MNDVLKKTILTLQKHWMIAGILVLAFILRIAVLIDQGVMYNLASDDVSYIYSAKVFVETGTYYFRGSLSAQTMPGMTFLLAPFIFLLGDGFSFYLVVKLFWIFMGLGCMYGVYKIILIFTTRPFAALGSVFFLAVDFAWCDNLILSETPYMLSFVFLFYQSIMLQRTRDAKYFWWIIPTYIFALFMRPTIAPFPLFLCVYLLVNAYDPKALWRQLLIAGGILTCVLVPWIYRNYQIFDKFIPLTYGVGNPKLLGSYQGDYHPKDEDLNYQEVWDSMSDEMMSHYDTEHNRWEVTSLGQYYALEADNMMAEYRMKQWWKDNPKAFLKAYLYSKPKLMMLNSFYWNPVLHIPASWNMLVRELELVLWVAASLILLIRKKHRKEWLFLTSLYLFMVMVGAYTFAFSRYAHVLYFMRFIIIGIGLYEGAQWVKSRNQKKTVITANEG